MKRTAFIVIGFVLAGIAAIAGLGYGIGYFDSAPIYSTRNGALDGYDPVAFFADGQALRGDAQWAADYAGTQWRFRSAANRQAFLKNPERYVPQYGGYCAYAMSEQYTAHSDPEAWTIVDDRLYLNFDASVQSEWNSDRADRIVSADQYWPRSPPGRNSHGTDPNP